MAILRLCRLGCKMRIQAHFVEFGDFDARKIVKLLFRPPKLRTSCEDTRFEVLCVKISSAVSSVGLFPLTSRVTFTTAGALRSSAVMTMVIMITC